MAGDSFRNSGAGQPPSRDEANVTAVPTEMVTVKGLTIGTTRHVAGTLEIAAS
jgi:hypothetical protein